MQKKQWPLEAPFAAQGKLCKRVTRKELEGLQERASGSLRSLRMAILIG